MGNQFNNALDKATATSLFRLAKKYQPESKEEKRNRLKARSAERAEGGADKPTKRPFLLSSGVNTVTRMIEKKKAQLVIIAHDVEPIEVVVYLPALCRKMNVPYCIVKGKARLGQLVGRKQCSSVAFSEIKNELKQELAKLVETVK